MAKPIVVSVADAELIGAKAIAFLASEPERLGRFMALSGIDPQTLRGEIGSAWFLAAVLDHLLSDETLLLTFAANAGMPAEAVYPARNRLTGDRPE